MLALPTRTVDVGGLALIADSYAASWAPNGWHTYWSIRHDGHECQSTYDTAADAIAAWFGAYAWPGGYPIGFYPTDAWGSLCGVVLCADCALTEYQADPSQRYHRECEDGDHDYDLSCDNCYDVIAGQNTCPDHGCDGWSEDGDRFVCTICATAA